jgi:hypothetical protein
MPLRRNSCDCDRTVTRPQFFDPLIPLTCGPGMSTIHSRGAIAFALTQQIFQEAFSMTMLRTWAIFIATLLLAGVASAQMPKPGPETKKLDYFAGNWTCDGDLKPGPMGPGGKMTMTDESNWMDGGFFVVLHSQFKSASMGNGNSIAFLGYDSDEKKYTYNEFNSMGETVVSKGTVDGDTWTWMGDMKAPPGKGRYTEKLLSPSAYSFKFEFSSDGNTWALFMDGKCSKNK